MELSMLMETEMVLREFGLVLVGTLYNMGYKAHSVRPNRPAPTSYSSKPLDDIGLLKGSEQK